jgi:hypothetical protein
MFTERSTALSANTLLDNFAEYQHLANFFLLVKSISAKALYQCVKYIYVYKYILVKNMEEAELRFF